MEQRPMTEQERNELGKFVSAYPMVEKMFPADAGVAELRTWLQEDIRRFYRFYAIRVQTAASKAWKVPIEGTSVVDGHPYMNKKGRYHRLQGDPRKVKIVRTYPVVYPFEITPAAGATTDPDFLRYYLGTSKEKECVMLTVVTFTNGETFDAQGTSSPDNLKGKTGNYPIEMAATRSVVRAIGLAVGDGTVAVEELNGIGNPAVRAAQAANDPEVRAARDRVRLALAASGWNEGRQIACLARCASTANVDELTIEECKMVGVAVTEGVMAEREMETKGETHADTEKTGKEGAGHRGGRKARPHQPQSDPGGAVPLPLPADEGAPVRSR